MHVKPEKSDSRDYDPSPRKGAVRGGTAIVSGLSEELSDEHGDGVEPDRRRAEGSPDGGPRSPEENFRRARMRHATGPAKEYMGPGWVASNRRLVADVGLPHAESWYARMLSYQSLGGPEGPATSSR